VLKWERCVLGPVSQYSCPFVEGECSDSSAPDEAATFVGVKDARVMYTPIVGKGGNALAMTVAELGTRDGKSWDVGPLGVALLRGPDQSNTRLIAGVPGKSKNGKPG
jgi:hypothetical protein